MTSKETAVPNSPTINEVEKYLADVAEPARTTLQKVREAIRAAAPAGAAECFSYGVPAFRLSNGSLAGYAVRKNFCSYYPMSGRVITKLKEELKSYTTTSGAIQFPLDKPLSTALIKKLVKARLSEIEKKK